MPEISSFLELQNLQCSRDNRVLFDRLDYQFEAGDIVHIEGPNGRGKTTLLRALTGLFPDYEGDILWQGQPISRVYHDYVSDLVFIGHLPGIKKQLTPRENLTFLSNFKHDIGTQQITEALAEVGLYGYEDMPGHQLSAGQQRRVALARLYIANERLWMLDEPYTALDAQGVQKFESLFQQHTRKGGVVLLTSHQKPTIKGIKSLSLMDYAPSEVEDE